MQVIVEGLACLRRWVDHGRLSASDVDQHMGDVSNWDSLLIAACIEANVDTLYSEDLGDGEQYDTVNVVNPFA